MNSNCIKNILVTLTLASVFLFQPLSSKAIDNSYDDGRPLFVEITTDWCSACKYLKPTVEELKRQYGESIIFIRLDATSEASAHEAEQIAANYGIREFFINNRNVFPRVAIYCPGGLSPKENLLGAQGKIVYTTILDDLLLNTGIACSLNGRPPVVSNNQDRPDEVEQVETIYGRPDIPALTERPEEANSSGRPHELTFWTYGEPMPLGLYFYSRSLTLPECSGGNQLLCYEKTNNIQASQQVEPKPAFKPYNPNATRNEKGFKYVN